MAVAAHSSTPVSPAIRADLASRAVAGLVLVACSSFLLVAAGLDPNPAGIGTHCQLGMAPCGFVEQAGLPCATCGMTTAVALAADGRLIDAVRVQPAGATLAVVAAAVALLAAWSLLSGMRLTPVWDALWNLRSFVAASVLVLGAWLYKIAAYHGMF